MNSGSTIFYQLIGFLSHYEFQKCVSRYDGDRKMKSFSCWDQYLCMAFAQLTYRDPHRDLKSFEIFVFSSSNHNNGSVT